MFKRSTCHLSAPFEANTHAYTYKNQGLLTCSACSCFTAAQIKNRSPQCMSANRYRNDIDSSSCFPKGRQQQYGTRGRAMHKHLQKKERKKHHKHTQARRRHLIQGCCQVDLEARGEGLETARTQLLLQLFHCKHFQRNYRLALLLLLHLLSRHELESSLPRASF